MSGEQFHAFAFGMYVGVGLWNGATCLANRLANRAEIDRQRQERARCAMFERLGRRAIQEVQLMELIRSKLGNSSNERQLDAIVQIGSGAQAQLLLEAIQEVET